MRQLAEGDSELVYIDRLVHLQAAGRQDYTTVLRAFRFTLRQLRAEMGSNTLKVQAGRFEELTNALKRACHETLGATVVPEDFVQIPAIPRTHNAKPMRNVVQRLFLDHSSLNDVSEIANPSCLLELKTAVDEWRFQQALPVLDERC